MKKAEPAVFPELKQQLKEAPAWTRPASEFVSFCSRRRRRRCVYETERKN